MSSRPALLESSVSLLLKDSPGESDPEQIIRAKARDLVRRAIELGWSGPPFDVALLADLRDIRVDYEPATLVEDAMLVPDLKTGQFTIKIGKGMPLERQRFNIGHEITHTFFPDCAETIQLRGGGRSPAKDSAVETLCDFGAAEMLFPLNSFTRDVTSLGGPRLSALTALRERYQASWEATANRLVDTADVPCAMVVLRLRLKPTEERYRSFLPGFEPRPKLRVDYAVLSNNLRNRFVPPHKSIDPNSRLYDLIDAGRIGQSVSAVEDWSELSLGTVEIEAMCLPTEGEETKVLAVVRPAELDTKRFSVQVPVQ